MLRFGAIEFLNKKLIKLIFSVYDARNSIENKAQTYGREILFLLGIILILGGVRTYSYSQYNPERTEAQNEQPINTIEPEAASDTGPEGVCCVEAYPQQLLTLPSEPGFTVGPEGALALNAEAGIIAAGPESALTVDAELGNAADPENATPQEAEPLDPNYDDSLNRFATGNLFRFIEGAFGALVMVSAGIGAIVAAAFGAYKAAISLLFVAVGAFILRALVSLFFGTNYPAYGDVEFVGGEGL